jgi:sec-independent protein translocase protein TatC
MPVLFGIAFQTPLVMVALDRLGVVGVDFYRRHRKVAVFVLAVASAVLTVTPDAVGMASLFVPLWLLYEAGILLCRWSGRPPGVDLAGRSLSSCESAEAARSVSEGLPSTP